MCSINENTDITQKMEKRIEDLEKELGEIKENTKEILDALNAAKGGFKVLGVLANILKYLTMIGAFCLFVYGVIHPSAEIKNPLK